MSDVQKPQADPEVGDDAQAARRFERWALLGVVGLVVIGLTAVKVRRGSADDTMQRSHPDDLLIVEIGGPRGADDRVPRIGRRGGGPRGTATDAPPDPPRGQRSRSPTRKGRTATRSYVIQPGETLGEIAARELGSVTRLAEILELNDIANADRVRAGDRLTLPTE